MKRQQILRCQACQCVVVCLLIYLTIWSGPLFGASAAQIALGGSQAAQGYTFNLPLTFHPTTNLPPNVVAMQADVLFDPVYLSVGTVTAGPVLNGSTLVSRTVAPGVQRIVIYSAGNIALTNGVVASVPVTVTGTAPLKLYSLALTNVLMTTAGVAPVPASVVSGFLDLTPIFIRPDGNVDLFLSGAAGQNYIVQASTDLRTWVNISASIVVNANYLVSLTDTNAHLYSQRFYRLMLLSSAIGAEIGIISRLPTGVLNLRISGANGQTYIVQASTNLTQWIDLSTNSITDGIINFTDTDATNLPFRFYRAKLR